MSKQAPNSTPPPSPLGLWLSLIKTYRRIQFVLGQRLKSEFSLSLPQFQFLSQLAGYKDGRRLSELADELLMTNGNVTGLSRRLNQNGWVDLVKDQDDKRATLARLSQKGESDFQLILEKYDEWVNELFEPLTAEEMQSMREYLRNIRPF